MVLDGRLCRALFLYISHFTKSLSQNQRDRQTAYLFFFFYSSTWFKKFVSNSRQYSLRHLSTFPASRNIHSFFFFFLIISIIQNFTCVSWVFFYKSCYFFLCQWHLTVNKWKSLTTRYYCLVKFLLKMWL